MHVQVDILLMALILVSAGAILAKVIHPFVGCVFLGIALNIARYVISE